MRLAFILYKFFPFGGLQRDFLRIAQTCQARGHDIVVYTMQWDGDRPEGFEIHTWKPRTLSAHARNEKFHAHVFASLKQKPADVIIGFNKMPGLDVYYAADTCYEDKARHLRSRWYRYGPRYRHFSSYERAVFDRNSHTESLLISAAQKPLFEKYYGTAPERLHLLPPGISRDRRRPENGQAIRAEFRQSLNIDDDELLLLMIGSGFKTKGLDRALLAIKALPETLRRKTRLFVIGQDNPRQFQLQAHKLGIARQITFFSGRDDVPRFLLGADMLIHPAYNENTGTVLLEALVAGLPVFCTEVCGYAHYITDAKAGELIKSPFNQQAMNTQLIKMLESTEQRKTWQANALMFADTADIYSMPEHAADLIDTIGIRLSGAAA
ncbi:glycosyltransferase family 4 protein [Kistimonas asteriae]|uniref:glycosyltransferase family 4 protein n=1 Tax=Kistimonas asteriae TaxID=517724 RepID=UPI001BAD3A55|nr:glycosyltransferase family 4 protein [Kistimonas asteriae]